MPAEPDQLAELLAAIQSSKDYRDIDPDLVRKIGIQELAIRRNLREAVKAVKSRLHQVGGAYQPAQIPYADWARQLAELPGNLNHVRVKDFCAQALSWHASTRERLPYLQEFYATLLQPLQPITSLLDMACGLNPLALPWMGLTPAAQYFANEIYGDMIGFLTQFFNHVGQPFQGTVTDLTEFVMTEPVDLVLLLKTLPCLEHLDKDIVRKLLTSIKARACIVTFPARSLGGRSKGMPAHYEARFLPIAEACGWQAERHLIGNELAFVLRR